MIEFGTDKEKLIKMTLAARKEKADKDFLEIWDEMCKAASAGRYEVIFHDKVLDKDTIAALREQGFEVKTWSGEIDDWGNYYAGWTKIYWRASA